jgi:hypothetical protein
MSCSDACSSPLSLAVNQSVNQDARPAMPKTLAVVMSFGSTMSTLQEHLNKASSSQYEVSFCKHLSFMAQQKTKVLLQPGPDKHMLHDGGQMAPRQSAAVYFSICPAGSYCKFQDQLMYFQTCILLQYRRRECSAIWADSKNHPYMFGDQMAMPDVTILPCCAGLSGEFWP